MMKFGVLVSFVLAATCMACDPSSLGFACSVAVSDAYTLHYTASDSEVHYAAEVQTTGWVALGFSLTGGMVGTEAVIGQPSVGSVIPYRLTGLSQNGVQPDYEQEIYGSSISSDGATTVMSFYRALNNGGAYEVMLDGTPNDMVFAYSSDGTDNIQYHGGNRMSFSLVYETGDPPVELCDDGSELVECLVDPCEGMTCPNRPNGVCVPNYCGSCSYHFVSPRNPDRVLNCDLVEGFYPECRKDTKRLCGHVDRNDPDAVTACLLENWFDLKKKCRGALEAAGVGVDGNALPGK